MSAELKNSRAENGFEICLEGGIGFQWNVTLAAHYNRRAAAQGDPDGVNNLGFSLEHGRDLKQDIDAAAQSHKFETAKGPPRRRSEDPRCLRILGRWEVPDRPFSISDHSPTDTDLPDLVLACLGDFAATDQLVSSISRLRSEMSGRAGRSIATPLNGSKD
jgi:hypothetical protein